MPSFEENMSLAISSHAIGDQQEAFAYRVAAFSDPEKPTRYDAGRSARDMSASLDRMSDEDFVDIKQEYGFDSDLGRLVLADAYAEYAYREHKQIMKEEHLFSRGTREFIPSAMYAAINAARQDRGRQAVELAQEAWSYSTMLTNGQYDHQYDVNLVGRVAGIKGYFERPPYFRTAEPSCNLRAYGGWAVSIAKSSESPEIEGSNPNLSDAERHDARRKAVWRGRAARTITQLQSLPTRNLTRPISKKLLDKVVL